MQKSRELELRKFEQLCDSVSKILAKAGITTKDLLSSLPEARKRVFKQRYGTSSSGHKGAPRKK